MIYRCHTPHIATFHEEDGSIYSTYKGRLTVGAGLLARHSGVNSRGDLVLLVPACSQTSTLRVSVHDFARCWEEHERGQ
jgi:hypothetical protein